MGISKPGSQDAIDNHGSPPQLTNRSADPFPAVTCVSSSKEVMKSLQGSATP